jgi:hypothetical protein
MIVTVHTSGSATVQHTQAPLTCQHQSLPREEMQSDILLLRGTAWKWAMEFCSPDAITDLISY